MTALTPKRHTPAQKASGAKGEGARPSGLGTAMVVGPPRVPLATHEVVEPAGLSEAPASGVQTLADPVNLGPKGGGKIYLAVPFEEKDLAKSLGARWEAEAKKWYVPEGRDPYPFKAWWPFSAEQKAEKLPVAIVSPTGAAVAPPLPVMTEPLEKLARAWKHGKEPDHANIYRWLQGQEALRPTAMKDRPDHAADTANLASLQQMGAEAAFPLLARLALDKTLDLGVRLLAIRDLGMAGVQALPFLDFLAKEQRVYIRAAVAETLVNIGENGSGLLLALAKDDNELVREKSYTSALAAGPSAEAILLDAGRERYPSIPRSAAIATLRAMGESAAPVLQRWLRSTRKYELIAGAEVLQRTQISKTRDFERENVKLLARVANKASLDDYCHLHLAEALRHQAVGLTSAELEPYLSHKNATFAKEARAAFEQKLLRPQEK